MLKKIIIPAATLLLMGTSLTTVTTLAGAQSVNNFSQSTKAGNDDKGVNQPTLKNNKKNSNSKYNGDDDDDDRDDDDDDDDRNDHDNDRDDDDDDNDRDNDRDDDDDGDDD